MFRIDRLNFVNSYELALFRPVSLVRLEYTRTVYRQSERRPDTGIIILGLQRPFLSSHHTRVGLIHIMHVWVYVDAEPTKNLSTRGGNAQSELSSDTTNRELPCRRMK